VKPPRQTVLCREGWYYLLVLGLIFGGAMLREVNLLLVLAGMLLGPMVFSWRSVVLTLRGLRAERHVPDEICAGDLLLARLHLRNTRRRLGSWGLVVEEEIRREGAPRRERPLRTSVLFPYVPAGESRKGGYRGRLVRRGRYRLGPLRVSTRFPFGLFRSTITLERPDTVVVFPRLGRLTGRWARRHRLSFAGTHRRERRPGPEGDFYGVRPRQPGDGRRRVHWRASARAGEVVVRQFEQPRNRDLAVLVDLWQPPQPTTSQRENVELAVSFAATVVAELCRAGDSNLLLGTTGEEPQCTGGPASAPLLKEMMRRLALAEAHHRDGLDELLETALGRVERGTEVVLVSTRPVDLSDTARFARLWSDPARRNTIRRIRCVDTSSPELSEFFHPE